jgi:hypothetical protein
VTQTSAQRKLARGVEQVRTLNEEAEAFIDAEAYVFRTERERRAPDEIFCRCYATERIAPPDHWPLLAGEAIQNLRSALDHAVWQAWRSVKENTGDGDHTQFLICDSPAKFRALKWRLEGVPEAVRAIIERSQPYNRMPQAPARDILAIHRSLSNADKHRTLAVVAGDVEFEMIGHNANVVIEEWSLATGKRLGEGTTEVSSFVARSEDGSELDEMDVQPSFTYDIRVEWVRLDFLRGVVNVVYETLTEIETGSGPNPFGSYPLQLRKPGRRMRHA